MLRQTTDRSFPFVPSNQPEGDEWMTADQETVTSIYGWAAVGAIAFVVSAEVNHLESFVGV